LTAYLLGKQRGQGATFLPEINDPASCPNTRDLNW
jgi:hypothetical protein